MDRFNYQIVLTGVIVGLAMSEILACVVVIVTSRRPTRAYWLHLVWLVLVFLMCVQYWFAAYYWRTPDAQGSSFVQYLTTLAMPVMLYLAAAVMSPREPPEGRALDFREYYYQNYRGIFGVFALTVATMAVQRTLMGGGSWVRSTNLVRGAAVVLLVSLMLWGNRRFHEVMAFVLLGIFVAFVIAF